jgi:hypothetical protein
VTHFHWFFREWHAGKAVNTTSFTKCFGQTVIAGWTR